MLFHSLHTACCLASSRSISQGRTVHAITFGSFGCSSSAFRHLLQLLAFGLNFMSYMVYLHLMQCCSTLLNVSTKSL